MLVKSINAVGMGIVLFTANPKGWEILLIGVGLLMTSLGAFWEGQNE